ncbi:MAG: PPC domain-containing DNA-binding protein [Pyramidobacter sp.]|jgi:predicted DNA-binding protein with PD1-like motif
MAIFKDGAVRTDCYPARAGRVVLARIRRDTDLVSGIIDVCRKSGFRMSIVEVAIGSLRQATFCWARPADTKRGSERTPLVTIPGPIEFISGNGFVSLQDPDNPVYHFHAVFCDGEGKVEGGHFFAGGNPVHSTMDVVIQELLDVRMDKKYDEEIDIEIPIASQDK